jgi:hypothetical protein
LVEFFASPQIVFPVFIYDLNHSHRELEGAHVIGWQSGEHRVDQLESSDIRKKLRRSRQPPFHYADERGKSLTRGLVSPKGKPRYVKGKDPTIHPKDAASNFVL